MGESAEMAKKRFRVECSNIAFERKGTSPLSFGGPGHIGQDAHGRLEYVCHIDANAVQNLTRSLTAPAGVAGSVLKEENYFLMRATPISGDTWLGRVAGPEFTSGLSGAGIARGTLYEVTRETQYPAEFPNDFAKLYIPKRIEFPVNAVTETKILRYSTPVASSTSRDCSEFKVGTEEFQLYPEESYTVIGCRFEKDALRDNRHIRLQEALEFALGQLLAPCALELSRGTSETVILRSSADWDFKSGKQFPPLRFDNVPWQPDVYFVIAQYYQAIADYTGDKIHPLSFGPHSIINTADAILELQVLAVSVAAESLIEAAFPQIVTETQDFLNDVESLSNRIENLGISTDRLKARLKGVLREFPKARNSDRLRKFVEKYGLEQRLFKDSWQSLRNLAAHGGMIPPTDYERTICKLRDVLCLCYAIVLEYIGYKGQRTNYSKPGWPTESYQPALS